VFFIFIITEPIFSLSTPSFWNIIQNNEGGLKYSREMAASIDFIKVTKNVIFVFLKF